MKTRGLTPKQLRFCEEYLSTLDAKRASTRAQCPSCKPTGYYVYFLIDPRDGKIFYVGKGTNKRVFSHVKQAHKSIPDNAPKVKLIREIIADGQKVHEFVFQADLSETQAYKLEKVLIEEFRAHGLTNIANGCVSNEEAHALYAESLQKRLKTYDEWISSINQEIYDYVVKSFGSTLGFYNKFKAVLDDMATQKPQLSVKL